VAAGETGVSLNPAAQPVILPDAINTFFILIKYTTSFSITSKWLRKLKKTTQVDGFADIGQLWDQYMRPYLRVFQ
jgi:hypothetical protein